MKRFQQFSEEKNLLYIYIYHSIARAVFLAHIRGKSNYTQISI